MSTPKRRNRKDTIARADILIGDIDKGDPALDGLPSNTEICEAMGCHRSNVSVIMRQAVMRMQLRLVCECVSRALPTWTQDAAADVVVFVIERRMSSAIVHGDVTIDDVLDLMDARDVAC